MRRGLKTRFYPWWIFQDNDSEEGEPILFVRMDNPAQVNVAVWLAEYTEQAIEREKRINAS